MVWCNYNDAHADTHDVSHGMQVWHSRCSNLHRALFKSGLRSTGVSHLLLPRLRGGGKKKESLRGELHPTPALAVCAAAAAAATLVMRGTHHLAHTHTGHTHTQDAAKRGDAAMVARLLDGGADIEEKDGVSTQAHGTHRHARHSGTCMACACA